MANEASRDEVEHAALLMQELLTRDPEGFALIEQMVKRLNAQADSKVFREPEP